MKSINKYLAGAVLSVSFLFSTAAQAMPIPQFDKMTHKQQADFSVFLIKGAANILATQGNSADAQKVLALLAGRPGEPTSPLVTQFIENLNGVRNLNQKNASDPNFKPFEVEHALSLSLKQDGIFVPPSKLLLVSETYKPSGTTGSVTARNEAPPAPTPGNQ